MSPFIKRLYQDALRSTQYNEDMKRQDPEGYVKPNIFSHDLLKHLYAVGYYGWMIGKGIYNRKNYE